MSLNRVTVQGTLAGPPKAMEKPAGNVVGCQFTLITSERVKDSNADDGYRDIVGRVPVRIYNPDAWEELQSVTTGDNVAVNGAFFIHKWEADGQKQSATYLRAFSWGPDTNFAVIKGNLGNDPETHEFDGGGMKVRLSIATEVYIPGENGAKGEKVTVWVPAQCYFASKAKIIAESFAKGDEITVYGRYQEEAYEKDGQPKRFTYVKVQEFDFGRKRGSGGSGGGGPTVDGQPPGFGSGNDDLNKQFASQPDLDDEIPF